MADWLYGSKNKPKAEADEVEIVQAKLLMEENDVKTKTIWVDPCE